MNSATILQSVSRSFALCIPLLEDNKVKEVENMYLLSRVADTIEDSSLSKERKKQLMRDFFGTIGSQDRVENFVNDLKDGIIDAHDKVLAVKENYQIILDTFHSMEKDVQEVSLQLLGEMSSGMIKFLDKEIEFFEDLDEYCYYVAGTVGLYMNRLVRIKDNVHLDEKKAVILGRYLQKVNVIKNFCKDVSEGRKFWPTELKGEKMEMLNRMIENAKSEATMSFEYIASVPYKLSGYRKFLLLSTLMATENIKLMRNNVDVFTNTNGVKIPRNRMSEIFAMVEEAAVSNDSMWKFVGELS